VIVISDRRQDAGRDLGHAFTLVASTLVGPVPRRRVATAFIHRARCQARLSGLRVSFLRVSGESSLGGTPKPHSRYQFGVALPAPLLASYQPPEDGVAAPDARRLRTPADPLEEGKLSRSVAV
jgi:hypothetical protein